MDKKPTEKELLDVVKEVGAGYQAILVNLNIQKSKIESFESTRKPDVICFDGLVFWRDGNGLQPINWNTLLSAVQKAGYPDFAEEKRKELQKDQQKKDHQNPPPPGTKADPDIGPKQVEKPKDICFAIVTANKNEWNSARHFLGAKGCDVSDSIKDRKCEEELNVVFESKKFGSYSLLRVYGKKGVIFQCPEMGSYSRGGSQYAVFMLLKEAMKNRWPLQVIFIVGCCGGVSAPDSKEKVEGTVFVANSFYQYAGKIEQDKRIKIKLSSHNAEMDWIQLLITSKEGGSEGYKVDRVEQVPFFSGDFVIKGEDFAKGLHELLQGHEKVGYEMEGIGAITGVTLFKKFDELLPVLVVKDVNVPNPPVLVVKGVSDTAGSDKNKEAPIRFFSKIENPTDEDTRQQMCTVMSLTLVLRTIKAAVDVGMLR
jgi:nucleoside phosphorylase